jgi:hypothetical protein
MTYTLKYGHVCCGLMPCQCYQRFKSWNINNTRVGLEMRLLKQPAAYLFLKCHAAARAFSYHVAAYSDVSGAHHFGADDVPHEAACRIYR